MTCNEMTECLKNGIQPVVLGLIALGSVIAILLIIVGIAPQYGGYLKQFVGILLMISGLAGGDAKPE